MTILCSILDDPKPVGDQTFGLQESPIVQDSPILRPRILLADDHPEVLEALRPCLDELGEVVGMVGDGQALVEAARLLEPDLIFADISMPRLNGLDATRAILACQPKSKVIILTVHREAVYLSLAFNAGARGYVLKRSAMAELPQAFLHVLVGDRYIGQGVGGREEWASAEGDESTTWRSTL